MDNFKDGGDFIGAQEALEICMYRTKIICGDLVFDDKHNSGLQIQRSLSALLELSVDLGFYNEYDIQIDIFKDDIAVSSDKHPQEWLFDRSFVAYFDSGSALVIPIQHDDISEVHPYHQF